MLNNMSNALQNASFCYSVVLNWSRRVEFMYFASAEVISIKNNSFKYLHSKILIVFSSFYLSRYRWASMFCLMLITTLYACTQTRTTKVFMYDDIYIFIHLFRFMTAIKRKIKTKKLFFSSNKIEMQLFTLSVIDITLIRKVIFHK